ncbi:MAG: RNA pseudouridine synthase [Erysipelotrichaceae bacterium]
MINVVFEDNHLLVVVKPFNVPMQEDSSKDQDMLSLAKAYLKEKYQKPGNVYLGLVHRLDRPTGGICVFAKTSKAAGRLSDQIRRHMMEKQYIAIVENPSLKNEDTLTDYLLKDEKTNIVKVHPKGKYAQLSYRVLKKDKQHAKVLIDLKTGRSHQIRVQFSSRNHPLYGDQKYNPKAINHTQLALWATTLSFQHPTTKENLVFTVQPPDQYPFNL